MLKRYIFPLRDIKFTGKIGNKAKNLQFLIRNKYRVPETYICIWDAYESYMSGDKYISQIIKAEIIRFLRNDHFYAVRSSANIEDNANRTFAGQFKTILNVGGSDNIFNSIELIWQSATSPTIEEYLRKNNIKTDQIKMAVIIQSMVNPVYSGISFSKNPLTGQSEIIVEAIKGSGEKLLQEGETPERWVNKWGAWIQEPESSEIESDIIGEIVKSTIQISKQYRNPVDLEWVFDGNSIYFVQVRKILLSSTNIYSNKISREMLPGIIKPLVWSINVPVVNGAWVKIITKLTGYKNINPLSLSKQFYYRAYFDMKVFGQIFELFGFPQETLELLMGIEIEGNEKPKFKPGFKTYLLMPRILIFMLSLTGLNKRLKKFMDIMKIKFSEFAKNDTGALNENQLINSVDRIFMLSQITAYYNIIIPVLALIFNRLLQRILNNSGFDYKTVNLDINKKDIAPYNPQPHIQYLKELYLDEKNSRKRQNLLKKESEEPSQLTGVAFQEEFDKFVENFGHFSDSGNDFSVPPWRENPELVKKMIINYDNTKKQDSDLKKIKDLKFLPLKRIIVLAIYKIAVNYLISREAISSLYTFGYGQFRNYFLAIGNLLAKKIIINKKEDIFYLFNDEIREIVSGNEKKPWADIIDKRKNEIEISRDYNVPDIIFGDEALPIYADLKNSLQGIPASQGIYTGHVKVLRGLNEIEKMHNGDVLVIPYSDVGWVPLFAKAGAVISESGGILSHSSIIAREYGIPAVLSVYNACKIPENTVVTVDGFKGKIYIEENIEKYISEGK